MSRCARRRKWNCYHLIVRFYSNVTDSFVIDKFASHFILTSLCTIVHSFHFDFVSNKLCLEFHQQTTTTTKYPKIDCVCSGVRSFHLMKIMFSSTFDCHQTFINWCVVISHAIDRSESLDVALSVQPNRVSINFPINFSQNWQSCYCLDRIYNWWQWKNDGVVSVCVWHIRYMPLKLWISILHSIDPNLQLEHRRSCDAEEKRK